MIIFDLFFSFIIFSSFSHCQLFQRNIKVMNSLSTAKELYNIDLLITLNTKQLIIDEKMNKKCQINITYIGTGGYTDVGNLEYFLENECNKEKTNYWIKNIPYIPIGSDDLVIIEIQYSTTNMTGQGGGEIEWNGKFVVGYDENKICGGEGEVVNENSVGRFLRRTISSSIGIGYEDHGSSEHNHDHEELYSIGDPGGNKIECNPILETDFADCCGKYFKSGGGGTQVQSNEPSTGSVHVHDDDSGSISTTFEPSNMDIAYYTLVFCESRYLHVESDAVLLFDSNEVIENDENVNNFTEIYGRFPKGDGSVAGETGGSNQHTHIISNGITSLGKGIGITSVILGTEYVGLKASYYEHYHTYTGVTDPVDNRPDYFSVQYGLYTANEIPSFQAIYLTNQIPPAGYSQEDAFPLIDDFNFPFASPFQGKNGNGGNNVHSHNFSGFSGSADEATSRTIDRDIDYTNTGGCFVPHTHLMGGICQKRIVANTVPSNFDLFFVKRNQVLETELSEEFVVGCECVNGVCTRELLCECKFGYSGKTCSEIKIETILIIGGSVGGFVLLLVIIALVLGFCWVSKKRKKGKRGKKLFEEEDEYGRQEGVELEDDPSKKNSKKGIVLITTGNKKKQKGKGVISIKTGNMNTPTLKINLNMFLIDYKEVKLLGEVFIIFIDI